MEDAGPGGQMAVAREGMHAKGGELTSWKEEKQRCRKSASGHFRWEKGGQHNCNEETGRLRLASFVEGERSNHRKAKVSDSTSQIKNNEHATSILFTN